MIKQSNAAILEPHLPESSLISGLLASSGGRAKEVSSNRWHWNPSRKGARRQPKISIRLINDWVLFAWQVRKMAPLELRNAALLTRLLQECRGFSGGVKAGLELPKGQLWLTAEAPLDDAQGMLPQLEAVCSGILVAGRRVASVNLANLEQRESEPDAPLTTDGNEAEDQGSADDTLRHLALQTGWPFTSRSDKHLVFEMAVSKNVLQASLVFDPQLSLRLTVELPKAEQASEVSNLAIRLLLLTSNRLVRMGRAVCQSNGQFCWEYHWLVLPSASELQHALTALFTACQLTFNEVEALTTESVAEEYLAVWECSP